MALPMIWRLLRNSCPGAYRPRSSICAGDAVRKSGHSAYKGKHLVVVALGQKIDVAVASLVPATRLRRHHCASTSFECNSHSMHPVDNGNLALIYLEDDNIADGELLRLHPQKKNVTATK